MGTIKFRVWSNGSHYAQGWIKDKKELAKCLGDWFIFNPEVPEAIGCEINQYTGLHDRNGNEIYEGDIVKSGMTGAKYMIMFGKYHTKNEIGIGFWKKGLEGCTDRHILSDQSSEWIIGNIYEHPHLLNP